MMAFLLKIFGVVSAHHHPAALRNRGPIRDALQNSIGFSRETRGVAVEIGSGTGAHIETLAEAFPRLTWHPTEFVATSAGVGDPPGAARSLETLDAVGCSRWPNVAPACNVDASCPLAEWPGAIRAHQGNVRLVLAVNVCHIAAWSVAQGIIAAAGALLDKGGSLVLYGPFKVHGQFTSDGNAAFDASLRHRNPCWGIREVEAIDHWASTHGLALTKRVDMPANNFLLHLQKL